MKNSRKIANIALWLVLALLLVSEIFVINQNFGLKKKISEYGKLKNLLVQLERRNNHLQERNKKLSRELSLQGKRLSFLSELQLAQNTNSGFFAKNAQFLIAFCFSINDCGSCLRSEILTWNDFAKKVDNEICQVIGVTDTTGSNMSLHDLSQTLRIKFPLFAMTELQNHLSEYDISSTPAVILTDRVSKKIIYAFLPTTSESSKDGFMDKTLKFVEIWQEKS